MEKIRFLLQVPWGRPAELLHKAVTRKMLEDRTTRLCWQKQPHAEHGRTKRRKLKKEKKIHSKQRFLNCYSNLHKQILG